MHIDGHTLPLWMDAVDPFVETLEAFREQRDLGEGRKVLSGNVLTPLGTGDTSPDFLSNIFPHNA